MQKSVFLENTKESHWDLKDSEKVRTLGGGRVGVEQDVDQILLCVTLDHFLSRAALDQFPFIVN